MVLLLLKIKNWQILIFGILLILLLGSSDELLQNRFLQCLIIEIIISFFGILLLNLNLFFNIYNKLTLKIIAFCYFLCSALMLYGFIAYSSSESKNMNIDNFILFNMFYFTFFFWVINPYLLSKSLVSAERKIQVKSLNKFIGEYFLFLFFLIGFWFIIPRINKLTIEYEKKLNEIS